MLQIQNSGGNHRQKLPLVKMAFVVAVCALQQVRADDVGTVMPWDAPDERFSSTPNYIDTPAYTNYHSYPTFPGDRMGDNGLGAFLGGYGSMYGFPFFGGGMNFDHSEFLDDDHPD